MNRVAESNPVLKAESLSYRYKEGGGFEGFSIEVHAGSVTALLGPNGCGKTTVLRVLSGLLKAQGGTVSLASGELKGLAPKSRARNIAMVAQKNEMPFSFTVRECVLMGRYSLGRPFRGPDDTDEQRVDELLARWDMRMLADRPIHLISGGELQKVLVLRALAQDSPVVLLDEPSNNLDPANQSALASLIRSMADEGRSVIVVLHDLNLASAVADKVILMRSGRIVAQGDPDSVLTEDRLKEVFGTGFMKVVRDDDSYTVVPRY